MGSPKPRSRAKYDAKKDIAMHKSSDGTYHGESG
jgi:hypothetical protein